MFFHNSLQPLPRLHRCKRSSKLSNAIRVYSHSCWLETFCTTNSSRVLARERWQIFENSWKKTQYLMNTLYIIWLEKLTKIICNNLAYFLKKRTAQTCTVHTNTKCTDKSERTSRNLQHKHQTFTCTYQEFHAYKTWIWFFFCRDILSHISCPICTRKSYLALYIMYRGKVFLSQKIQTGIS